MAKKRSPSGRCICKKSKKNGRTYCFKLTSTGKTQEVRKIKACKKPRKKR